MSGGTSTGLQRPLSFTPLGMYDALAGGMVADGNSTLPTDNAPILRAIFPIAGNDMVVIRPQTGSYYLGRDVIIPGDPVSPSTTPAGAVWILPGASFTGPGTIKLPQAPSTPYAGGLLLDMRKDKFVLGNQAYVEYGMGVGTPPTPGIQVAIGGQSLSSVTGRGLILSVGSTLTATANNDVLIGTGVGSQFNAGAFTGVSYVQLAVGNVIGGANNTLLYLGGIGTPAAGGNWAIYSAIGYNSFLNAGLTLAGNLVFTAGAQVTIGTTDNNGVLFETNGSGKLLLTAAGSLTFQQTSTISAAAGNLTLSAAAGNVTLTPTGGNTTISTGNLTLTSGMIGIGVGAQPNIGLIIQASRALAGGVVSLQITDTLMAAANSDSLYGMLIGNSIRASTFSTVTGAFIRVQGAFVLNTGSFTSCMGIDLEPGFIAATTNYGIFIGAVTSGTTNNYGIYVTAPTGTGAIGILVQGGGINVTGGLTIADAASQIVPGATSLALTNHANNANNLLLTDAGAMTLRGKIASYNGVATQGWGVPAIPGYVRPAQQTNTTVTMATCVVGASDGSFRVSANVNITVSTTVTMSVTCTYTDENNAGQTLTMSFKTTGGTVLVESMTTALGNIAYMGFPFHIRAKSGTTISIQTAGTVTATTYTCEGIIEQIA